MVFSARKYEHTSPLLRELHWLKVPQRIQFRLNLFKNLRLRIAIVCSAWRRLRGHVAVLPITCPAWHCQSVTPACVRPTASCFQHPVTMDTTVFSPHSRIFTGTPRTVCRAGSMQLPGVRLFRSVACGGRMRAVPRCQLA